jgi:hypothetical protein
MNELRRMAYLDALGIDSYVSRRQLPGAAVTRRLAIRATSLTSGSAVQVSAPGQDAGVTQAAVVSGEARPMSSLVEPRARARVDSTHVPRPRDTQHPAVPRFSLVTLVAGDWLWLEELAGMPLATEQVHLVQSMASALNNERARRDAGRASASSGAPRPDVARPDVARPDVARPGAVRPGAARPEVMQFDWPIHANRQLDQGEEAARAGVAGFLARRLEQHGSRGVVLLGQAGAARVPTRELGVITVCTASTAEMLGNPVLKRQAWRDLLPLIHQP